MTHAIRAPGNGHVFKTVRSPVGRLTVVATDQGLAGILWENDRRNFAALPDAPHDGTHPILVEAERQLGEYFAGRRTRFDLTLAPSGTSFQRAVWNALLTIPFGATRSYARVAADIGSPRAVRAVGAAAGRNPLSIVVPCHRVVGATGALTGFAGGLDVKARLLALEGARGPRGQILFFARMSSTDDTCGADIPRADDR